MHAQPKAPSTYLVGIFSEEDQIMAVTQAATDAGLPVYDTYTPYAVHGLDTAQKLPRSKVTFIAFFGGMCGFMTAGLLQSYTQGITTPFLSGWPLNLGGKPYLPWTAFVPVFFELTVLFAGLSSAIGMFAVNGLFPGKKAKLLIDGVTNDRFAIAIDPTGTNYDEAKVRGLFAAHGATEVAFIGESA